MVKLGLECFLAQPERYCAPGPVALIMNQASHDSRFVPAIDLCARSLDVAFIWSPEHGVYGFHQDMEAVQSSRHPYLGLPVVSLYGDKENTLTPGRRMAAKVSTVIYDIQDIGCRYYTFVWTLLKVMRACRGLETDILVLDRPNPIMPLPVNGPPLHPRYESFVGGADIPVIYQLTAGELALYLNHSLKLGYNSGGQRLTVVPMEGYDRNMFFHQTGLPWSAPSPNMPCLESALVYPGGCLVEGTNLSEGRGTTRPFLLYGAPYIEPHLLAAELNDLNHAGLACKPTYFRPMFGKHHGCVCGGVEVAVSNPQQVNAMGFILDMIRLVARRYTQFRWRSETYEFRDNQPAFDLLTGGADVREALRCDRPARDIMAGWHEYLRAYCDTIQGWRIY